MKKLLSLLLVIITLLSLFACTGGEQADSMQPSGGDESAPSQTGDAGRISPLLWKVSDENGNYIYLFGTIHVGDSRTSRAVELVSPYIGECGAVAVEIDMIAYRKDYSAAARDLAQFVYTDGTTIKDHIPEETYDKAVKILKKAKLYNQVFDRYNTAYWGVLVDNAFIESETKLKAKNGVDMLILTMCHENGTKIYELENAADQYQVLNSSSDEFNLFMLEEKIQTQALYGVILNNCYAAWLEGDPDMIERYSGSDPDESVIITDPALKEEYDRYLKALVYDRNAGMFEKAKGWYDSGEHVFVTAGAAHMVGEHGVVAMFEKAGYNVEKIDLTKK